MLTAMAAIFIVLSIGICARNESRVLSLMSALPVNAGTPASSMRMLSRCSEHPLNVPIARHHGWPVELDDQEQGFYRGLPLIE